MPRLPDLDQREAEFQEEDSLDCVPACVATVLRWQGIDIDVETCRDILETSPDIGTDFELADARLLAVIPGLQAVTLEDVPDIYAHLGHATRPCPVIAQIIVNEDVLGYSAGGAGLGFTHAVVVVEISDAEVGFFDPLSLTQLNTATVRLCSLSAFSNAWLQGLVLTIG